MEKDTAPISSSPRSGGEVGWGGQTAVLVTSQKPTPPPASRGEGARRWVWPHRDAAAEQLERELARQVQVSPLLARLLHHRGVKDPDAARTFLDPALAHLHDPLLLPDMDKAVARLGSAIDRKEPVLLYADYDVDGNSGAAVLHAVLTRLGAVLQVHVPDRVKDGYGLKKDRLARAAAEGVKVVISIDSGVTEIGRAHV